MSDETKSWPAEWSEEVRQRLLCPFPNDVVEFLPRAQSNGKALGLAYVDARAVMNRLDSVVGPGNWSFDFDLLDPQGKMIRGRLTILGVTKCDAGEAAQEDEPLKSAVSDAIKRCAVHFGISRYLYYLPRVWAPYDAQKRKFIEPPRLEPRAVEEALRICGYTGPKAAVRNDANGGGLHKPSESAPKPTHPESSGDRAASGAAPPAQKAAEAVERTEGTLPLTGRAADLALDEKREQLAQLIAEAKLAGKITDKQQASLEGWQRHPQLDLERATSFIRTLQKQLGETPAQV